MTLQRNTSLQRKIVEIHGCYTDIRDWDVETKTIPDDPANLAAVVFGAPKSKKHPSNMSVEELVKSYVISEELAGYLGDV